MGYELSLVSEWKHEGKALTPGDSEYASCLLQCCWWYVTVFALTFEAFICLQAYLFGGVETRYTARIAYVTVKSLPEKEWRVFTIDLNALKINK